jgi:hypothetical protein
MSLDDFREVSLAADAWEAELRDSEASVSALEADLRQKGGVLRVLEAQLDLLEDRQLRFKRLLEIFEAASGTFEVADRKGEMLRLAQSVSGALADHAREVADRQEAPRALGDVVLLLADFHSRLRELELAAFRRGAVGSPTALQRSAARVGVAAESLFS